MQWLLPRLQQFNLDQPDITLNFVRYTHSHNFWHDQELDAAIQFGEGEWPGAVSRYLTGKNTVPICSPSLIDSSVGFDPEELTRLTLLQHIEVPYAWQDWCDYFNLKNSNGLVGPRFNQYSLIIKAAMSGFGIGLVPECLVEEELRLGRLINPVPRPYVARQGYYFCVKEDRESIPPVNALRTWLLSRLSESAGQTASCQDS
jgi:DNA-binding transcriptional LysR family regulator